MSFFNGTAPFLKPEVIGVRLQRKLPAMTKTQRALLGLKLETGSMQFSPRQASRFAEVAMKYIRAAAKAAPGERWAMLCGRLRVEDLHARQLAARRCSPAVVDKRITKSGIDLALASIDRLTAPVTNGAPATNGAATPTSNGHNQAPPPAANDSNDAPDLWGDSPPGRQHTNKQRETRRRGRVHR